MLVSGCGGSSSPDVAAVGTATTSATSTTSTTTANNSASSGSSTQLHGAVAFARCMRAHGVQNFPDPDSHGNFPPLSQQALAVSKQTSLTAQQACEHLLLSSGGNATPQQRQQRIAFGVKVAQCLRAHGYPNFPDPTGQGQELPPGLDPNSPQFQTTEAACEKQAQKALGLP
jgi:hypothetical protein